jgi:CRISPR-associated protein Cmr1
MKKDFVLVEATYSITTPMFCGGADRNTAELRIPGFKGALRFWWRSMMWSKLQKVKELHKKEAELFGSSDQNTGQSRVKIQLLSKEKELDRLRNGGEIWEKGNLKGAYYLGYGVVDAFGSKKRNTRPGELLRPMIPGGQFTVRLKLGPNLAEDQLQEVQNALILLGTVGGLGSKSRKGFGSLTLTELSENGETVPLESDPGKRLKRIFRGLSAEQSSRLPEWTAWSGKSRVLTVDGGNNRAVDLLDKLGGEQVYFRSWGRNGTVLGKLSEKNFQNDHDFFKKPVPNKHPERVVFGLPHNYGKESRNSVEPVDRDLNRRASPLFIHIHQTDADSVPVGVVAFLPSRFLPKDKDKLQFFGEVVSLDQSENFWNPIHGYLDRLVGKEGATVKKTGLSDAGEVSFV